jgi:hypothetical protein
VTSETVTSETVTSETGTSETVTSETVMSETGTASETVTPFGRRRPSEATGRGVGLK